MKTKIYEVPIVMRGGIIIMYVLKRIKIFLLAFFIIFFISSPVLMVRATAIDEPAAREVMAGRLISINPRFPTLSIVSLKLGDDLNLVSAEYLLGKALDSSGPIQQGNLRIEQVTFEHGTITTRQFKIWSIRCMRGKTTPSIKPSISKGGSLGGNESQIIKFYGEPLTTENIFPDYKTITYTNGQNYVKFDISNANHKVEAFEIGLL